MDTYKGFYQAMAAIVAGFAGFAFAFWILWQGIKSVWGAS